MKEEGEKKLKMAVVFSVLAIIILTILEFPAPIGFETRPQNTVPMGRLYLFFTNNF